MKDYIYLDQEILNSTLAQIDNGLNTKISSTQTSAESSGEEDSQASNSKFVGGFPGVLQASLSLSSTEKKNSGFTAGQSEMIDTILHDSAVDLMLEKFSDKIIRQIDKSVTGDYVFLSENYRIYDFDLISKITDTDYAPTYANLDKTRQLKIVDLEIARVRANNPKNKATTLAKLHAEKLQLENDIAGVESSEFYNIHYFAKMVDVLLPNTIYFKAADSAILAEKNNFRINTAQIQTVSNLDRKIHVVGIVTSIQEKTHANGEFEMLKNQELNKIPIMMTDVLLSNFDLLQEGDRLIKPIAIFFE